MRGRSKPDGAAEVSPTNALPEYPRPQMVRAGWKNLNGLWHYAITSGGSGIPSQFTSSVLVPYPLESALSGVQKTLRSDQLLWYERTLQWQPSEHGARTLLHFGAVNYEATVYVNGREMGCHLGGYQSFTVDITPALKQGRNELIVKVSDPTDSATGPNPRGKQGTQYTASSGIWQTVWVETVPETYVDRLILTPDVDRGQLNLDVHLNGKTQGYAIEAVAKIGTFPVARRAVNGPTALRIKNPRLWSPDAPFLYDLQIRVVRNGKIVDEVKSYFGFRKIEVRKDAFGIDRLFLNGRYTYNLGVLDQGFWPDGIYTAPTDAALKFDIQAVKAMGFNTIRKHLKVEPERWYYHCDTLGILVWQDMVPPANKSAAARAEFEREIEANFSQLHNHPSITTWVLFNEGGGAYDQERLARWMKRLDPTRLLDGHTGPVNYLGWTQSMRRMNPAKLLQIANDIEANNALLGAHTDPGPRNWIASDMTDFHHYPDPKMPPTVPSKARVAGENGGIGVFIEGHVWNDLPGYGYVVVTPDRLQSAYAQLVDELKALEVQGLSGSIYTQPYDIESEQNGLMTYDRAVIKFPLAEIARINSRLLPHAARNPSPMSGIAIANADTSSEAERYAALLARYRRGERDKGFLRHFALMALRQNDQAHATEAGNAVMARSTQPYSSEMWEFINAITQTSKDAGFEALRTQPTKANVVLGAQAAQRKIVEVITHEEIAPFIGDASYSPDWNSIEGKVVGRYGELGLEAVNGARMFNAAEREDWVSFGTYYVRYLNTAAERSEVPLNNLSYHVFLHVMDPRVLQTALQVMKHEADSANNDIWRPDTATILDTYANLLYKTGSQEAVQWEEKAHQLSEGTDSEIDGHLEKMKAGSPTWPAT